MLVRLGPRFCCKLCLLREINVEHILSFFCSCCLERSFLVLAFPSLSVAAGPLPALFLPFASVFTAKLLCEFPGLLSARFLSFPSSALASNAATATFAAPWLSQLDLLKILEILDVIDSGIGRLLKSFSTVMPTSRFLCEFAGPALKMSDTDEEAGSVTRCVCGDNEDNEGFMVACDECGCWQHGECVGLNERNLPEKYYCEQCHPDDPLHARRREQAGGRNGVKPPVIPSLRTEPLTSGACVLLVRVQNQNPRLRRPKRKPLLL